jgi:multidrug resistance efflux pump
MIGLLFFPSPARAEEPGSWKIVCTGRVEAVSGEVNIIPQIPGLIQELNVFEGEQVTAGAILAVLAAKSEKAQLELAAANLSLAQARLKRVKVGSGQEEIKESYERMKSVEAELGLALWNLDRFRKLRGRNVISEKQIQEYEHKVASLQGSVNSLQKRYEAVKRGPLPEEIAVAQSQVKAAEQDFEVAQVNYNYRFIKAPFAGTVLHLYLHAGDSVQADTPTPILRLADTSRLRIRAELNEADIYRITVGQEGSFSPLGARDESGRITVQEILPLFGPKRLFDPDTTARVDTRTIQILCDIKVTRLPVYCGQRVTITFENYNQ